MPLNTSLQGKAYPPLTYEVTAEAITKYAQATNETNPLFLSAEPIAPPAFAMVAAGEAIKQAMLDPDLDANMAKLVQGDQSHKFDSLIKAGDVLSVLSTLSSVVAGDGQHSFTITTTLTKSGGERAVELQSTMLIRGTGGRARAKARAQTAPKESESRGEPAFEVKETVDDDQTFRYAEASGDHNAIHVDPEYARNTAGLPGVIVHGMCTMAFSARAVLDSLAAGDPELLRFIKAEFSRPVFPGETLTTRGWLAAGDGNRTYDFETLNTKGRPVIRGGAAEIR